MCEREYFSSLSSLPGSGLEMVTCETEVQGYQVVVVGDWALNRARWALNRVSQPLHLSCYNVSR